MMILIFALMAVGAVTLIVGVVGWLALVLTDLDDKRGTWLK